MSDRLILLVDTDSTDVDRLTQQLSPFGYSVDHCKNVFDIGERITARKPSVLLVRVDSGPTAGSETTIETVARILTDGDHKTPTIFLADDYDMKSRLASIRIGAKAFFVRPYSPLDLVDALDLLTEPQEEEPFRVLIVDDDERISEFYIAVLEHTGMQAMALSDPMKVLDALSDFRPELVLMDQYMPEIEGRELGAVIRQEAAFLSIPIVFLSAESDPDKQLELMEIGADEFLTKPISPERLVAAVRIRAERFRRFCAQ
ncbi:MAG: response regulator [Alphaproteobacteria bacterium]|nr:response regulator [Alphaproteobacteria bacterium]